MFPLCGIFCPPHRHRRDLHEAGPRESHRPPFSPQALLRTRPISDLKFQISNPLRTRAPKALDCWENHSSQSGTGILPVTPIPCESGSAAATQQALPTSVPPPPTKPGIARLRTRATPQPLSQQAPLTSHFPPPSPLSPQAPSAPIREICGSHPHPTSPLPTSPSHFSLLTSLNP